MKQIIASFLAAALLFSLLGCQKESPFTQTDGIALTETKQETEEKKTQETKTQEEIKETQETAEKEEAEKEPVVYDKADDPLTPEKLAAIPIANASMSTDQLRQICVDYVKLSVSFQWIPNKSFSYKVTQTNSPVKFEEGNLWGGIPYINVASGNLYRILEYYDSETGILDMSYFVKNKGLFGTACSGTAGWGWQRVVNSATFGWTQNLTRAHGFIPVGPYEYDEKIVDYGDLGMDCSDIAAKNGQDVMYESYAQTHTADCLVSNGHVRMTAAEPVVVRNEDGTINGKKSYISQVEQVLYTWESYHHRTTKDGTEYDIQGNDGYAYTFEQLYRGGYLPHTFAEFLGTDPVEDGSVHLYYTDPETLESVDFTGDTITVRDITSLRISANYAISDVFATISDPDGKVLFENANRSTNHFTKSAHLVNAVYSKATTEFAPAGTNTLTVSVQLSNGQLIPLYSGILTA